MAGLLPQDEIPMGLLGDPRNMALLSAAAALLEGGGPSLTPTSFGQNLGRALTTGMGAYQQGLQQATQNALMKRQFARQDKQDARADRALDLEEQRLLKGQGDPSPVREWEYYSSLPPEKQEQYLLMKRSGQITDIAGVPHVNTPQGFVPLSTLGQEVSAATTKASATAQATAQGKAKGEAVANLPGAQLEVEKFSQQIDNLITHPGMSGVVGVPNLGELIPGTPESDFKAMLEQVQGGAFLQAMESLKGSGQISEIEGEKATQAILRAQKAQSEDAFVAAMLEAKYWAQRGFEAAQQKAGVTSSAQPQVLRYNPSTGRVE